MRNLKLSYTILLAAIRCYSIAVFSQDLAKDSCSAPTDSITKKPTFLSVDTPAEIEGGLELLHHAMATRIKFSAALKKQNIDGGKIIVGFIIDENGDVTGKRIIKNIDGTNLAEQMFAILSNFKWKPGRCNGKAVLTFHSYPVNICLRE